MRTIDADELKEEMNKKALDLANGGMIFIETINNVIDNAPTVDISETISKFRNTAYQNGFTTGLNKRPQSDLIKPLTALCDRYCKFCPVTGGPNGTDCTDCICTHIRGIMRGKEE